MGAGFRVIKPGFHTLIQDGGRRGHFRLGLTTGGPADRLSFLWANRLTGNRGNTTALEITLGGLELEATAPTRIAITGADAAVTLNGMNADTWRSHRIAAGTRIRIATAATGTRLYLAVAGGFAIAPVFSSTATVTRENLGGIHGGPLKQGDFLPFTECGNDRDFFLPAEKRPLYAGDEPFPTELLNVVPGWQARLLPRGLKRAFFSSVFSISADSNRMGIRLSGKPLPDLEQVSQTLVSEGIVAGAIQIPPDGLPIVMHCDHQTIGGYPKIGTLIAPHLWRLAQLPPGSTIRFQPVTLRRAQQICRQVMRNYEATCPLPVILGGQSHG